VHEALLKAPMPPELQAPGQRMAPGVQESRMALEFVWPHHQGGGARAPTVPDLSIVY
jgi:hypothetical protein